jgi:hypothetical protein
MHKQPSSHDTRQVISPQRTNDKHRPIEQRSIQPVQYKGLTAKRSAASSGLMAARVARRNSLLQRGEQQRTENGSKKRESAAATACYDSSGIVGQERGSRRIAERTPQNGASTAQRHAELRSQNAVKNQGSGWAESTHLLARLSCCECAPGASERLSEPSDRSAT